MFQTYNYDSANDQDMRNIQAVINALSWDLGDLSSCFRWSQKHTWWKSRIVSIKSFANAMVNGVNGIATEKSLPSQYLRRVGGKKAIGAGE
jgi:hypothetical protein